MPTMRPRRAHDAHGSRTSPQRPRSPPTVRSRRPAPRHAACAPATSPAPTPALPRRRTHAARTLHAARTPPTHAARRSLHAARRPRTPPRRSDAWHPPPVLPCPISGPQAQGIPCVRGAEIK
ncbi:hypothetical protein FA95DRAFT_1614309 [Auriscalpium vulgare]|uniref:Uncharacterized protein n=1 Tax=Auriscalpium vulgare TaxID=40419 RepID=A0ACB8QZP2_9AGAM|nr:hypothetical protein FA95DRAFT_1614309 [Auriscalpium vulgare]